MLRVAAMTAAALLALLASCFSKPEQPHVGDGDGGVDAPDHGGGSDAGSDAQIASCTDQPTDTFDSGTGCGAVGTAYGPIAVVSRSNNQLSMAATGSGAGCSSATPFSFANGTSIKVAQISQSGMTNTTTFTVRNAANTVEGMQVIFNAAGGSMVYDVQCLGVAGTPLEETYDPVAQLYWKFEASAAAIGMMVHAYYSANGTTWTDTGLSCAWTSVANVKVDLGVGPTGATTSTLALFDDFNIKTCPP